MTNLLSFLIQSYAKSNGISGPSEFAKSHRFKDSTANDWWNGKTSPQRAAFRRQLFEFIPHPALSGLLTLEKKKRLLGPVKSEDRKFAEKHFRSPLTPTPVKLDPLTNDTVARFAHLIKALLPDLKNLISGSEDLRRAAKAELGLPIFMDFYRCVQALSSSAAYQAMESEHQLDSIKGGN